MAPNRLLSEIELIKIQLSVLVAVICMAVDTVNPVKIFLHVFPSLLPWHIATLCLIIIIYLFISQMKEILYYSVKIFFHSILSIFFRDVEIIGLHNIPRFGPVIYTINHANQFIDAVTVLCTCERKISYLMAEKSFKRRIVGDLAWALDVVPVKRPQDDAKEGTGTILISIKTTKQQSLDTNEETKKIESEEDTEKTTFSVEGTNTIFTKELKVGDKIRPPGTPIAMKVIFIESDTYLEVDGTEVVTKAENNSISFINATSDAKNNNPVSFDILRRIDQKEVYGKVLDKLADGGCIGIFPEGGSHDRTELLPLKVGVALIAYSALEKDGLNIPIVPVGLNYFQAHRWRGRAVVEYGRPILINPTTLKHYKAGGTARRTVCNELLERIEDSMKSVLVSMPDYKSLQVIHTARRLYQRQGLLETSEKQDLNRRFAEGFKRLMTLAEGNPPKEWLELQERIIAYGKELKELGLRDNQVPGLAYKKELGTNSATVGMQDVDADVVLEGMRGPYRILHLILLWGLASIPTFFINLPIGILAGLWAESRRKHALANSKVKVRGYDVMLTEKVVFCIAFIPTLWITYAILLVKFTSFDGPTLALILSTLPLFAYMGIIVSEAGIVGWKDLRPYFMRLFPSSRQRLKALPSTRKKLQADIRKFIKDLGPALGEIYYSKHLDWQHIQQKTRDFQVTLSTPSTPGTPTIERPRLKHFSSSLSLKDDFLTKELKGAPQLDLTTVTTDDDYKTQAGAPTIEMRKGKDTAAYSETIFTSPPEHDAEAKKIK